MARSGIGQDGFLRVKKETTYGTADTTSMTLWPVKPEALVKSMREFIENDNLISSRLKQLPNLGREVSSFEIPIDAHPTLLGQIFQFLLGTSTNGTVTDGTYVHTWLAPITGSSVGYSFTVQQALGSDLADTYAGAQIHELKMSGDNQGKILLTLTGTCEGVDSQGVARITSFSYPTATPLNFAMASLVIDPADAAEFTQLINSFELTINLGLDADRFKMGSAQQSRPLINTIPSVTLTANIDADKQFLNAARAQTTYDLLLTITSTEYAAGTTPYLLAVEIPRALLKADTEISGANDTLSMDVEFDCGYGGVTTGSGATLVMAEVRVRDAVATYA
jgi:hypothetical protein